MARVQDYCIDRWEISVVDKSSRRELSPYYPPLASLARRIFEVWSVERHVLGDAAARGIPLPAVPEWQKSERFTLMAVSRPGVVPQGYLSQILARRACEAAGKRLCTEPEWVAACKGAGRTRHPYGDQYVAGHCNVFRPFHPASLLHDSSSIGHTDPRLNLIMDSTGDPLLRPTGSTPSCVSRFGEAAIYDMVGNLDEWLADERGVFVGGFYARNTTQGCEAKVASHAPVYYDYSTGTRCCLDAR
jgi:hypothetical protein